MIKTNNDITSLFKHLGTSSEHYQEIGRSNEARESEARWPLLASIHASATAVPAIIPAVTRAASSPESIDQPVQIAAGVFAHTEHTAADQPPPPASRVAEFIAPRAQPLASRPSRIAAPSVHEAAAPVETVSQSVQATSAASPLAGASLPDHDASSEGEHIENVFARLAKPRVAPLDDEPKTPPALAPTAPEPKRSLFQRLIRT